MAQAPMSADVTSDDKLWTLLAYILTPIVPIIILLMEDKKNRPFIKFHAVQALALNVVLWVVVIIASITVILAICDPVLWLLMLWPAILAYQGKYFEVPLLTKFLRDQHWVS